MIMFRVKERLPIRKKKIVSYTQSWRMIFLRFWELHGICIGIRPDFLCSFLALSPPDNLLFVKQN
jgi:hypothetical protein